MIRSPYALFVALAIATRLPAAGDPSPAKLSFNTHVQPILSEYCYHCHGPDSGTRKPTDRPLRLDRAEFAFLPREDGKPAILKGKGAISSVVQRMKSTKADDIMPPPESHKQMKAGDIAIIEQWINEGAVYEEHWSLLPPQKPVVPPVPATAPAEWKNHPVDAFLLEKMTAAGLQPNPPEDRARLLRKVSFDLTGLPPSPEELSAFLADTTPAAYENAVDRLLASPRYGEHMARYWLDAARYADTHGIHIDNYRSIWPYRDWVIQAFNANMRFDQFTLDQIAGDMLPNPGIDQQIATGFHRCLPTTGEGGAIAEEYDAIYAKDRVDTTSGVWLGLSMGCASCHDHKFDPIAMKDFYAFSAFFRNTPMTALDGNKADHPPNLMVPAKEDRARILALEKELADTRVKLAERQKIGQQDLKAWLATPPVPALNTTGLHLHVPLAGAGDHTTGTVDGTPRDWTTIPADKPGLLGPAPVLKNGAEIVLGDAGNFDNTEAVSYGAMILVDGNPSGAVLAKMDSPKGFRGWDMWIQNGQPGAHVIHQWPGNADKVVAKNKLEPGQWHHVMVVFDGKKPAADRLMIFVNGHREAVNVESNTLAGSTLTTVPLRVGRREPGPEAGSSIQGGTVALQDVRIFRRALAAEEIASLAGTSIRLGIQANPDKPPTPEQEDAIGKWYAANADVATRDLRAQMAKLGAESEEIRKRGTITLVMKDRENSKPVARILERGDYSKPGVTVDAAVPKSLPQLGPDQPANRLGLARWLVDPRNPLPARVTVNRFWHQIFGTGIVETTDDFGIMGARPSHPALLDHLAVDFVATGWDVKRLVRTLVTTAAYRQSAMCSPAKLEKDPANRLLARAPRQRLDAEPLRDMILLSSGLLVEKTGGPSVKPYQPEGVWEAVAMKESNTRNYKPDTGEALYRRSLYTFWKRVAPHPSMETLNAPSRETFCTRRERTNTPLQALVLMNDPQFVEGTRVLAEHTLGEYQQPRERMDAIARRLLSRPLAGTEATVITRSLDAFLIDFKAEPAAAAQLVKVGASVSKFPDPVELAAWTLVASQILNMDECLTR